MAVTIKLRSDTAANWTSKNPTLAAGEVGLETNTRKFKIGNGTTAWSALSYNAADVSIPDASNTTKGISRFATDTEATAGALTTVGVNPAQLKSATTITEIDGGNA
jgi:hypothetical protein